MLGEALRLIRVFSDMTAAELAEKLNISTSYLSEIENGKKEPTLDLIGRYAKAFRTSRSSILFFSEKLEGKSGTGRIKDLARKNIVKFLQMIEKNKG